MPYKTEWVPNEVFLEHKGITVYHLYHNDEYDDGRLVHWYTTHKDGGEHCHAEWSFDVTELPQWKKTKGAGAKGAALDRVTATLRKAIEAGDLKAPPPGKE